VLSAITAIDTIYLESLKTGTNIPRPLKHEYKWFAQGSKIPVLQIDGNVTGGAVTVTNIQFKDSLRGDIPHVGIADIASGQPKFEVYPNPATDLCMIHYLVKKNASVNISVMDITGKLLFSKVETKTAGEQVLPLQTSDFPNGVYFIKLTCEHFFSVQKLVISHY
jgi:hypothetical protein